MIGWSVWRCGEERWVGWLKLNVWGPLSHIETLGTISTKRTYLYLHLYLCFICLYFHLYIYVYSFSLNPENVQPSGSCNFSRLHSTKLEIKGINISSDDEQPGILTVYAVNYNLLRIMSGMGGLVYSN